MEGRLITRLAVSGIISFIGCGGTPAHEGVAPQTAPLPTAGMAGRPVTVYPLTFLRTDEMLGWEMYVQPRRDALDRADSLIAVLLTERAPEVTWVLPDQLRRAARRAPGMLSSPDQMGTALLRSRFRQVPDPLRSQLRTLNGIAGGRYALIPASLVFRRDPGGAGAAELTLVIVDVRTGREGWRTVARGNGADPWGAMWNALKSLVPGLP